MKGIDLFCGIGGFHYAAKENSINIVFASESYQIQAPDNQTYKQFGNSVAVPCVSAVIKKILKTTKKET